MARSEQEGAAVAGASESDPACLFCGIVAGRVPAMVVQSDDQTVAFRDVHPQAPTHVLVIPRRHVPSASAVEATTGVWIALMAAAARVAVTEGLGEDGYRLVINTGPAAGQSVAHLHVHVLGGRALSWPPG